MAPTAMYVIVVFWDSPVKTVHAGYLRDTRRRNMVNSVANIAYPDIEDLDANGGVTCLQNMISILNVP
jgi:hypothetical protein